MIMIDLWFPVPPYRGAGWIIVNRSGELVATFEDRDECILACNAVNEQKKKEKKESHNE